MLRGSSRERSQQTNFCPHATPPGIVDRILELRKHRGSGAAPKLRRVIERGFGEAPCVATVHRILQRHGMIKIRKPRPRRTHPGPATTSMGRPNAVWNAHFKGHFLTGHAKLYYPLTV